MFFEPYTPLIKGVKTATPLIKGGGMSCQGDTGTKKIHPKVTLYLVVAGKNLLEAVDKLGERQSIALAQKGVVRVVDARLNCC